MDTGLSFDSEGLVFTFVDSSDTQKDINKNRFLPEIVKD